MQPTAQMPRISPEEITAYQFRCSKHLRRRIMLVATKYGMSYNGALNLLLREALDTRQVPEPSVETS